MARPARVMWVGAHPDDESTVAPLLAELCGELGADCTLLVATRGEAGECAIAGGCGADLGAHRAAELADAAAHYPAKIQFLGLPDGSAATPDGVAEQWAALRGGPEGLIASVRDAIAAFEPDAILAFDPRHGTTCHPDHRAIGALVELARTQLVPAPPVWLVEERFEATATTIGYAPIADDPAIQTYDATRPLPTMGGTGWDVLVETLHSHASQFMPVTIAAFAAAPRAERRVYLLSRDDVIDPDQRYQVCP